MTNSELIYKAAIESGLMTKAQADEFLMKCGDLPLHTYAAWQSMGYQVKKGEKAIMKLKLWKMSKRKKASSEAAESDNTEEDDRFILCPASLFFISQVEKIQPKQKTA